MKRQLINLSLAMTLVLGFTVQSCKDKKKAAETTNNTTYTTPPGDNNTNHSDPVTISGDDDLRRGITDATKDFPGVTAAVENGEVTLTGTIKRDRLPTLMQSIQSLQPKRVNNNLTIQ